MAVKTEKKTAATTETPRKPRARKTAAVALAAGKFKLELTRGKGATYTEPDGTIWRDPMPLVSADVRNRLLALQDDWGVPYFRDYTGKTETRAQKLRAAADAAEAAEGEQGESAGEIDTAAEGVVRIPRSMRRTEGGVKV